MTFEEELKIIKRRFCTDCNEIINDKEVPTGDICYSCLKINEEIARLNNNGVLEFILPDEE